MCDHKETLHLTPSHEGVSKQINYMCWDTIALHRSQITKPNSFHVLANIAWQRKHYSWHEVSHSLQWNHIPRIRQPCPRSSLTKISGGMEIAWTQKLALVQKGSVQYNSTLLPFMYTCRYLRYSKSKAKHFPPLILVYFSLFRPAIKVQVVQVALTQPRQKSCNTAPVKGKNWQT